MNIQIFGVSKCFDTKKAERWFKERRIRYQRIDLKTTGISRGELTSVLRAVGGVEAVRGGRYTGNKGGIALRLGR